MVNVGKYAIHGWSGLMSKNNDPGDECYWEGNHPNISLSFLLHRLAQKKLRHI